MGTLIGQYRIEGTLGSGGMGTVYVGEHTLLGRRAAIKLLLPELSTNKEIVERFFNEAKAAAAIAHPGIVQIFDFGFAVDGAAYIVMELLEGASLATLVERDGPLPDIEALRLIRQVASAMAAAHAAQILHRDLKPDNIFLVRDADVAGGLRAKVLDFGIAKLTQRFDSRTTRTGAIMGTPTYMAPEQARGQLVDERSDIYSLGCVLFHALVGSPPFSEASLGEVLYAHIHVPPSPPSSQSPGGVFGSPAIARQLDELVLRCLQKDPMDRFPSMNALASAIVALLDDPRLADSGWLLTGPPQLAVPHRSTHLLEPADPLRLIADSGPAAKTAIAIANPVTRTLVIGDLPAVDDAQSAPATGTSAWQPEFDAGSSRSTMLPDRHRPERAPQGTAPPTVHVWNTEAGTRGAEHRRGGTAGEHRSARGTRDAPGSLPSSATGATPIQVLRARAVQDPAHSVPFPAPGSASPPPSSGPTTFAQAAQRGDVFFATFDAAIPPSFRDLLPHAVEFFRGLFRTARLVGGSIELGAPTIKDLESRTHHVLFLPAVQADAAAPLGQIGTRMFRAHVDPFAAQLAALKVPTDSVLITVLAAPQLGQGARETIFALRKERGLFVIPIAAAEIRRACNAGSAGDLVVSRIADLHTISDPFATLDGSTDPTRWIGFAAEIGDLVKHIDAGGRIVSVAGPPGCGKTSMVAMAEYGCDTSNVVRRFVPIQCGELTNQDPHRLLQEMTERVERLQVEPGETPRLRPKPAAAPQPSNLRATIMALGAQPTDHRTSTIPGAPAVTRLPIRRRPGETGLAKRHQLVLVLEDADWLIRMASSAEPDEAKRASARELWRGLAELCVSGKHTVIVTSIRDFRVMEQMRLERPVSVSRVPMRALTRRESDLLITSLGELIGFRPTRNALAKLHRESGGNIYALRLICSDIIQTERKRPEFSPLARLTVTPRQVGDATERVVATGSSFRTHVSLWLDDVENVVLQHVAREHPRSPRRLRRELRGTHSPEQIAKALDGLELMSLVERRRGRHRIRIPLFERWINMHIDPPRSHEHALRRQRLRWISIGVTCTAMLLVGYWTWLRAGRSPLSQTVNDCRYELDYPDRISPGDIIELLVYQDCTGVNPHTLTVESVFSALTPASTTAVCAAESQSCTMPLRMLAGKQAHDLYQVRLRVDGSPVITARVKKDQFAAIRDIGEGSATALSLLPTVFAFIFSFHGKMTGLISRIHSNRKPRSNRAAVDPPSS